VTAEAILDRIPVGDSLVLDTSTVLAYLKGNELASPTAMVIVEHLVRSGRNPAFLSTITAAELLVRPIADGPGRAAAMRAFLLGFPGISIRSADLLVAAEAAHIRASTGVAMPDALIAATATLTSSAWLITNDAILRDRLVGFDWSTSVLLLADFAA
jgi:predicted nucleic acid-binding protein